jgi:hypothetical protein
MVLAYSVRIGSDEIEAPCPDSQKSCLDSYSRECMLLCYRRHVRTSRIKVQTTFSVNAFFMTCPDIQNQGLDIISREHLFHEMSGHPGSKSRHHFRGAPIS